MQAIAAYNRDGDPHRPSRAEQIAEAFRLLVAGLAAYALIQLLEAVFRATRATSATGK